MRFVFTNYSTSAKYKNLFYNTFPSKCSTLGFFYAQIENALVVVGQV